MQQMWIIAGDVGSPHPYYKTLQSSSCKVFSVQEVKRCCEEDEMPLPSMLVVDTTSMPPISIQAMNSIADRNPAIFLVHIIEAGHKDHARQLLSDEVIERPKQCRDITPVLERLLRKTTDLSDLAAIHARLCCGMGTSPIVGKTPLFRSLLEQLPAIAAMDSTVLIQGETGTGKELFARALHYLGRHARKPFVTVDCASLSESLAENELFGHSHGAYTDGTGRSIGLVQEADGGTLFIDEIECLSLRMQTKFLRLLQDHSFKPLGQSRSVRIDTRVVAATNLDLTALMEQKRFRDDLYYRLNVIPLMIPPLRKRRDDIPLLVRFFLNKHADGNTAGASIPPATLDAWMHEDWLGNVRELENRVQEWIALASRGEGRTANGHVSTGNGPQPLRDFREESDRQYLRKLITHTGGNISAAARIAGIDRKNLRTLLKKSGLEVSDFRS